MSRLSTEADPARKKEYWEDDFNILVKKIGVTPIKKLPKGNFAHRQAGGVNTVSNV